METKMRLQEALDSGPAEEALPAEVQQRLEALSAIASEAEALSTAVSAELTAARAQLYVSRNLGDQLYAMGVKETLAPLARLMCDLGEAHRAVEREGAGYIEALARLEAMLRTFKGAAIEDALLSVHKFNEARLDFLSAQASLALLTQANATPPLVPEDAQHKVAEKRELYERLGHDVDTKVRLLSEHRVLELSQSLSVYVTALRAHYAKNLEILYAINEDSGS